MRNVGSTSGTTIRVVETNDTSGGPSNSATKVVEPATQNAEERVSFWGFFIRLIVMILYMAAWIVVNAISYVGICKRMDFTRWVLLGLIGSATIWVLIEIERRSRGVPESLFVAIIAIVLTIGFYIASVIGTPDPQCGINLFKETLLRSD